MSKVSVGSVPSEAKSGGSLNESTPIEQRSERGQVPQTNGPRKHKDTGAFLPAEYEKTVKVSIDKKTQTVQISRRYR